MAAQTIETERLILRQHSEADFKLAYEMWNSPEVYKFIGGATSTETHTWMRLCNYVGHWALKGFGYWAVIEKSSGEYLGDLGFADFKRDINPSIKGLPEVGWALRPQVHGKGYATEALHGALAWGLKNLKFEKIVCIINPDNLASIRVAEKCGFKEKLRTTFANASTIMFEMPIK